jgi:hypothetical protein
MAVMKGDIIESRTSTPAAHQHPKKLSRSRSWDRVIVYDADSGNVVICKKKDVDQGTKTLSTFQELSLNPTREERIHGT